MTKTLRKHILHVFTVCIAAVLYMSCTEEVEPFSNEPAVKLRFFNMDSLAKVNASIGQIDTLTKYLNVDNNSLTSQLRVLGDSLSELNELIAGGREDLGEARASVENQVAIFTAQLTTVQYSLDSLSNERASLSKIVALINSGKTLLKKVEAGDRTISFSDSATTFALPLNMNTETQVYYLEVGDRRDSLELAYSVEEELTERSYIKLVANNVRLTGNHSYDSAAVYCQSLPDPCRSNETTINLYF